MRYRNLLSLTLTPWFNSSPSFSIADLTLKGEVFENGYHLSIVFVTSHQGGVMKVNFNSRLIKQIHVEPSIHIYSFDLINDFGELDYYSYRDLEICFNEIDKTYKIKGSFDYKKEYTDYFRIDYILYNEESIYFQEFRLLDNNEYLLPRDIEVNYYDFLQVEGDQSFLNNCFFRAIFDNKTYTVSKKFYDGLFHLSIKRLDLNNSEVDSYSLIVNYPSISNYNIVFKRLITTNKLFNQGGWNYSFDIYD